MTAPTAAEVRQPGLLLPDGRPVTAEPTDPSPEVAAWLEEQRADEIDERRASLDDQISAALFALSAAEGHLSVLRGILRDGDLAEGDGGQDLASHLRDAARSVRAARAVLRHATTPAITRASRTGGAA